MELIYNKKTNQLYLFYQAAEKICIKKNYAGKNYRFKNKTATRKSDTITSVDHISKLLCLIYA